MQRLLQRYFAAGMSGGIAYVLDEQGQFVDFRCNKASVDLEPVFDPADIDTLKNMIYRHFDATQSPRARWILEHWTTMLPKFVKVFPHDFRKALARKNQATQAQQAQQAGFIPPASTSSTTQVKHG